MAKKLKAFLAMFVVLALGVALISGCEYETIKQLLR